MDLTDSGEGRHARAREGRSEGGTGWGCPPGQSSHVMEADLIDDVRSGDPEAMAVLYGRYREHGLAYAQALMARDPEAEDVLHEAFMKVIAAIRNGYGPTDIFAPYLKTSIRSVALLFWKKADRERPTPDKELDVAVEDPGLENALHAVEHGHIAAALRTLPARWRSVLWHAEVLGMKPRDMAPVLGIQPNAVSALLIRARGGLRAAYQDQLTHEERTGA